MRTLRRGSRGDDVTVMQNLLIYCGHELVADGIFGKGTEAHVESFQEDNDLYADGVVGGDTWAKLFALAGIAPLEQTMPWVTVGFDVVDLPGGEKSYATTKLRGDVAEKFADVRTRLNAQGVMLATAGGQRRLKPPTSSNQSATSMHYVGRALDLPPYAGMVNPLKDPYVITVNHADSDLRRFIVWGRGNHTCPVIKLLGVTYEKSGIEDHYPQRLIEVEDHFVNITEVFADYGIVPIRARRSFFHPEKKNNGGAEWWHFQDVSELIAGETLFGDELLRVWSKSELENSAPWQYRNRVYGVNWF